MDGDNLKGGTKNWPDGDMPHLYQQIPMWLLQRQLEPVLRELGTDIWGLSGDR